MDGGSLLAQDIFLSPKKEIGFLCVAFLGTLLLSFVMSFEGYVICWFNNCFDIKLRCDRTQAVFSVGLLRTSRYLQPFDITTDNAIHKVHAWELCNHVTKKKKEKGNLIMS